MCIRDRHFSCPHSCHSRRSIRISIISTKNSVSQRQTLTGKERCFRVLTDKCHKRRPLRYYHNTSVTITWITYRRDNAICSSGLYIVGLQFIIRMTFYKLSPLDVYKRQDTTRISVLRGRLSPKTSNVWSCRTRSNFTWQEGSKSPISSKNIVPLFAISKRPIRSALASVNAPVSYTHLGQVK